jgi:hypothetical protein
MFLTHLTLVYSHNLHYWCCILASGDIAERLVRGWPLLTVKTEVNGDSKSTDERGPSLVGS